MVEERLSRRLAGIAREIQSRESVGEAAYEISVAAHEMLSHSTGAGITLVRRNHDVHTAAATSDVVREGDRLQYELRQGPCLDAAWEQDQVYSGDLESDDRWPDWGPQVASALGVRSMLCTQLFTNEDQLGALNVYGGVRYAFDEEDRETARLLGAHAAVAVAAAQEIETLKVAVDRRTTIGKALGIVMARYEVDDDQAMAVLRRLSSHRNRKLYDIALDVVRDHGLPEGAE
jgi:GAF domain-containing protein